MSWDTPLTTVLPRIPAANIQALSSYGIGSLKRLLTHLPFRYEDRQHLTSMDNLQIDQYSVVSGKIVETSFYKLQGKQRATLKISDGKGFLEIRFFYLLKWQVAQLQKAGYIRCFGKVHASARGNSCLQLFHPEYICANNVFPAYEGEIRPIYGSVRGVTQNKLRKIIAQALSYCRHLPFAKIEEVSSDLELEGESILSMSLYKALLFVHQPPKGSDISALLDKKNPFFKRIQIDELVAHFCSYEEQQGRHREKKVEDAWFIDESLSFSKLLSHLPFDLTNDQENVVQEIRLDMQNALPMRRLLQGDVGSGKTVVAKILAYLSIQSGMQVALLVPTESLAVQHYERMEALFSKLDVSVGLLTGDTKKRQRKVLQDKLSAEEPMLLVGTHALCQESLTFGNLGLVIIDEQHRFGVAQRLSLIDKGSFVHQLVMTATPIPRTLASTLYAYWETSVIKLLPKGRKPIVTSILEGSNRERLIARISALCKGNEQVYWVCPLIEQGEQDELMDVKTLSEMLAELVPHIKVAVLHGRLKSDKKQEIVGAFVGKVVDVLVSTTVIEVGIDVPNASVIVIENAERFGLAQLHQLRGRVGRGSKQSYCMLLRGKKIGEKAKERLELMKNTNDGFVLAEADCDMRGYGQILGVKQSGEQDFYTVDLREDAQLLSIAMDIASRLRVSNKVACEQMMDFWHSDSRQYLNA